MKIRLLLTSYLFLASLMSSETMAQGKSKIFGNWYNTEKTAQIEIMKSKSGLIGKIVWIKSIEEDSVTFKDVLNADVSLRNRPLKGLTILEGLSYQNGSWKGGQLYDPESGITYPCELTLKKKNLLEVKGYLGDSWVSKTVVWTKME